MLSEIDPAAEQRADPATFDMRKLRPALLPGQRQGAPAHRPDRDPGRTHDVLLRYVNAGVTNHSMGVLGARPDRDRAGRVPAGRRAHLRRRDDRPRPDAGRARATPRRGRDRAAARRSTTPACGCTTPTPPASAACSPSRWPTTRPTATRSARSPPVPPGTPTSWGDRQRRGRGERRHRGASLRRRRDRLADPAVGRRRGVRLRRGERDRIVPVASAASTRSTSRASTAPPGVR